MSSLIYVSQATLTAFYLSPQVLLVVALGSVWSPESWGPGGVQAANWGRIAPGHSFSVVYNNGNAKSYTYSTNHASSGAYAAAKVPAKAPAPAALTVQQTAAAAATTWRVNEIEVKIPSEWQLYGVT
ncbi:hypothetical protein E2C01_039805 [Portunus trituberculatus]|uniref:Uncharacterized protein n=1 Tax=Portunus trituberculatus TaxID=210409 RepID=A0A5B7FKR5_PORTR|nr:hypothetical protein [Portunus trituberculatus]